MFSDRMDVMPELTPRRPCSSDETPSCGTPLTVRLLPLALVKSVSRWSYSYLNRARALTGPNVWSSASVPAAGCSVKNDSDLAMEPVPCSKFSVV